MHENIAVSLALILVLGITAQWLAWRFKVPSILLLLLFGFFAGPVSGLLHPDEMFGDLLFPFVSISVAIILFEGGLSLKFEELRGVEWVVRLLISLGALITWVAGSLAAFYILGIDSLLAIILGAILIVTGPTVVIPLLRQVRPSNRVSSILKWEGIMIDPIGATLAVLVFEAIIDGGAIHELTIFSIFNGIIITLLVGTVIGAITARILVIFLKRDWIAPFLETAVTLMTVLAAFAISNQIRPEAGLMAATIMGIILANQKQADVRHITSFKEELGVLLLSILFIVLAARVNLNALLSVVWQELAFLAVLILVIRPLAVFISAIGSKLSFREKIFISGMAPRGIVAVAVASLFAFELESAGFAEAELLINYTFLVVVGTVLFYSLTAGPLAGWLNLCEKQPQGVLILGAHHWARDIASALQNAGIDVWLVDTNSRHIQMAKEAGLNAIHDSILADGVLDNIPFERVGRLLALTANSELNALASFRFAKWFGEENVYQLMPRSHQDQSAIHEDLLAHILFGPEVGFRLIDSYYYNGAEIISEHVGDAQDIMHEPAEILLFVVNAENHLLVPTISQPIYPSPGQKAIYLMLPKSEAATPFSETEFSRAAS